MPFTYFLRLAYQGTRYRGWQWQPTVSATVEQTLQDTLSHVQGERLTISGCGRTDAGVHASQFYARIQPGEALRERWLDIVNRNLPEDVRILEVIPVAPEAQARWDATSRTYDYFLHLEPNAFLNPISTHFRPKTGLKPETVPALLNSLLGNHDFRNFCKTPDRHNTTTCTLTEARLYRNASGDRYRFRFTANRFLRAMIRILVDRLWRVMDGEISPEAFGELLSGPGGADFSLAPPQGLFLSGVSYPFLTREPDLPAVHQIEWQPIPAV